MKCLTRADEFHMRLNGMKLGATPDETSCISDIVSQVLLLLDISLFLIPSHDQLSIFLDTLSVYITFVIDTNPSSGRVLDVILN